MINHTVPEVFQRYEVKSTWSLSFFYVFGLGVRVLHPFPERLFGNFPSSVLYWHSFDINDAFASGSAVCRYRTTGQQKHKATVALHLSPRSRGTGSGAALLLRFLQSLTTAGAAPLGWIS